MAQRPFRCPNCGNWHIAVPPRDGSTCWECEESHHARHQKTGVVDCHFGHKSATQSEIRMFLALQACGRAEQDAIHASEAIRQGQTAEEVAQELSLAEESFAKAEAAQAGMAEVLRWAGVMEMPGLAGESFPKRFKTIEALELLVGESRRPPEDLADLRRSLQVCTEMADEVPGLLARARVAIGQTRQAASAWAAPVTVERPSATDRMAHARAARGKKTPVAA